MDKVVLDTNIVSYLTKKTSPLRSLYLPHLQERTLCISFVTVGELYLGAEKDEWGEDRWRQLNAMIRRFVVLPYDYAVARKYAWVVMTVRRQRAQIDFPDAWLAATALAYDTSLVTHNKRHFEGVPGLKVISEYKP